MSKKSCQEVKELLPERVAGVLDPRKAALVEEHLEACRECGEEEALVGALLSARPGAPEGLADRIRARLREEPAGEPAREPGAGSGMVVLPVPPPRRWLPGWALPAAAVVVLALGTGVIWSRVAPGPEGLPQAAVLEPLPESWLWDDGWVAGAPMLDGLSDDDLRTLLEEMGG